MMMTKTFAPVFLLLMACAIVAAIGEQENKSSARRSLEDTTQVMIKYKEGHELDVQSFMSQDGGMADFSDGESTHSIPELGILVSKVTPSLMEALEQSDFVESVEVDQPREMHVTQNFRSAPRLLQQETPYGINSVQAPDVWSQGYRGNGVTVCVIDSGIDSDHPDFGNLEGADVFDDWDEDNCGHGTHVSGTVAATGNQRVIGVAPEATVFTVRIFGDDCNQIFSSDLINAALACRDGGAKVISMSLGGGFPTNSEQQTFNNLFNQNDILSIASAGNSGNSGYQYPASYPVIVSVAAVDSNNNRPGFSQANDQVDITAPGVDVLSTLPQNNCVICQGDTSGYGFLDGTSMSCPHVSGVAALLFNAVPNASPQQVRNAMEESALDLGQSGLDNFYGHGLVQAASALSLLDDSPTNPAPTNPAPTNPAPTNPAPTNPAPTNPAPTPTPVDCDDGFSLLRLDLTTDAYGSEVTWRVRNECTNEVVASGSGYSDNTQHVERRCLHSGARYTFTIFDSYGDGICCAQGFGEYTLTYDNNVLRDGPGSYAGSESTTFGSSCDTGPSPTPGPDVPECRDCDNDVCAGGRCLYHRCSRQNSNGPFRFICNERNEDDGNNCVLNTLWTWECETCNGKGNGNVCCRDCVRGAARTGCQACDDGRCASDRCLYQFCDFNEDDGFYYCDGAREVASGPVCQFNSGTWRCGSCFGKGNDLSCCRDCTALE